ncbi:large conductance mechanosensitive channel protein MscL [Cellulomonas composti]|uniref:Large-conductance mechanosensitive channel n=1 Tax=Cellulomonas composti TaxID=266130 RepID=A0A511JAJ0_9CELL|nr:large conductance mechanosensitive channel protein MscL [Cellulomonas composti]GEL95015.1 hypothetical protein CCO02nite_16730 [Cellulomonas composti]
MPQLDAATSAVGSGAKGLAKVGQGFKEFISRGNVVDLAVGVVIGAAFGEVVKAFVEAILNPLIGWIFGQPNLDQIWTIAPDGKVPMYPGVVLTQLITFVLTAAAIYFCVVLPLNALAARRKKGEEPEPAAPAEDILLLQEIRDLLAQQGRTDLGSTPGAPPSVPPSVPPAPPRA